MTALSIREQRQFSAHRKGDISEQPWNCIPWAFRGVREAI